MGEPMVGELNTNTPPTVAEVVAFLVRFPGEAKVWAYEGEGGSWILVGERTLASP